MRMPTTKSHMKGNRRSLRNLLLDRGLQLKLLRQFVLSVMMTAVMIGAFLWHTSLKLLDSAEGSVQSRISAAQAAHDLAVQKIDAKLLMMQGDDRLLAPWEVVTAEDRAVVENRFSAERAAALKDKQEIVRRHQIMIMWLVVSLLSLVALVAGASLFISHRIAGPAFRMRRLAERIVAGDLSAEPRGLRHGDELQDVFGHLCRMVEALRERELQEISALQQLLEVAERSADNRIATAVDELVKAKQLRLGTAPLTSAPPELANTSITRTAA